MQNVVYYHPGINSYREYNSNGTIASSSDRNTADRHLYVNATGYTGKRSKSDPNAPHAFHVNVQDYSMTEVYNNYLYASGYRIEASGPYLTRTVNGCVYNPVYPYFDALTNRALDNLSGQVRGDLDLSIDFAEWHQTSNMLKATKQVEDITRVFSRRFGALKTAGNAYLQYIYGIKPLLSDIHAAAEENIRVVLNKIERYSARATDYYVPDSISMPTVDGYNPMPVVSGKVKVSVTFGVELTIRDWDASRYSSLNPYSIAWELLPYSFVADWFFNVGGYLRNLETSLLQASQFRRGYKTVLVAADLKLGKTYKGGYDPNISQHFVGSARFRDINRTLLSAYPTPYLPSFQARLGSSRLLNAASLLTTLLSSGGRPSKSAHSLAIERRVQRDVNRKRKRAQPSGDVPYWPPGYIHM